MRALEGVAPSVLWKNCAKAGGGPATLILVETANGAVVLMPTSANVVGAATIAGLGILEIVDVVFIDLWEHCEHEARFDSSKLPRATLARLRACPKLRAGVSRDFLQFSYLFSDTIN